MEKVNSFNFYFKSVDKKSTSQAPNVSNKIGSSFPNFYMECQVRSSVQKKNISTTIIKKKSA